MHSLSKDAINQISAHTIAIIRNTLECPIYDPPCKRMATGLFQDISTNLEELMNQYQDQSMDILFLVLKNGDLSPDVKTIAI